MDNLPAQCAKTHLTSRSLSFRNALPRISIHETRAIPRPLPIVANVSQGTVRTNLGPCRLAVVADSTGNRWRNPRVGIETSRYYVSTAVYASGRLRLMLAGHTTGCPARPTISWEPSCSTSLCASTRLSRLSTKTTKVKCVDPAHRSRYRELCMSVPLGMCGMVR